MFDMSDGRVRRAPATRPIESYEVRISDGVVQARIRSGADP
jgi:nitrite reductase/ring-hydroxylating ferredoxin subunit